jgi:hypothetical protein
MAILASEKMFNAQFSMLNEKIGVSVAVFSNQIFLLQK